MIIDKQKLIDALQDEIEILKNKKNCKLTQYNFKLNGDGTGYTEYRTEPIKKRGVEIEIEMVNNLEKLHKELDKEE